MMGIDQQDHHGVGIIGGRRLRGDLRNAIPQGYFDRGLVF
jgi:hypothetical protein